MTSKTRCLRILHQTVIFAKRYTNPVVSVCPIKGTMSTEVNGEAEESPVKRPRLVQELAPRPVRRITCFDDLNAECLVPVLSFLEMEQINDLAVMNQTFYKARGHPSLDQTRTATIACKTNDDMSVRDLIDTIKSKGWDLLFIEDSQYKCLKLVGLEKLQEPKKPVRARSARVQLQSVTCLDVSAPPPVKGDGPRVTIDLVSIGHILPNLREVQMNHVNTYSCVVTAMCRDCPNLTSVKWNGCKEILLPPQGVHLTELHLDGCLIAAIDGSSFRKDLFDKENYMWNNCPRLERLSIKNTSWHLRFQPSQPITQAHLIKLVRYHPSLRWLRSDLTDENIAMLRTERPEVTLVNQ